MFEIIQDLGTVSQSFLKFKEHLNFKGESLMRKLKLTKSKYICYGLRNNSDSDHDLNIVFLRMNFFHLNLKVLFNFKNDCEPGPV